MLPLHLMLVTLQLVLSMTNKIGDTKYKMECSQLM